MVDARTIGASISELLKRWLAISWGVRSDELEKKSSSLLFFGGGRGGFWREWGVSESLRRSMGEESSSPVVVEVEVSSAVAVVVMIGIANNRE